MKKLIIVAAAVAMACASQAASFNWTSSGLANTKNIYASDGSTLLYSADKTAKLYLFDAATVSQANLLAGLRDGDAITDYTSIASQTIASNSRLTAQEVTYGTAGSGYNLYMAIVDGDNVYLGSSVSYSAQASDVPNVNFNGLATSTKSKFAGTDTAFSSAGWYAAVPEPTSGLLMLVGLGALALRRRKA